MNVRFGTRVSFVMTVDGALQLHHGTVRWHHRWKRDTWYRVVLDNGIKLKLRRQDFCVGG